MKALTGMLLLMLLTAAGPHLALGASLALDPATFLVAPGDAVDVDVVISGLVAGGPPSVGAFDLDVAFDPALLQPIAVTFGPFLGDPDPLAGETLTDFQLLAGIVDLAEVSLLATPDLDLLQLPASFTLATLSFTAVASGAATLTFAEIRVDDPAGDKISIPWPSGMASSGTALLALAVAARRRRPPSGGTSRRH